MLEMRMYKQGDRMRFEAGKDIAIVVDEKGNAVQFDHANKTAMRPDLDQLGKNSPKPSDDVKSLKAKLQDLKGEGVERDGEETLDGTVTTVYALKDIKLEGTTTDRKVWVDPKRKLPVRMEMTKGNAGAEVVMNMEYSGWNEELDEKLFSFDVPAGYKLDRAKEEVRHCESFAYIVTVLLETVPFRWPPESNDLPVSSRSTGRRAKRASTAAVTNANTFCS